MSAVRGGTLATARVARGLTQGELARRAGVSQGWLSKAEADLVTVDPDRAGRLAEALDYPASLLTAEVSADAGTACVFNRKRSSLAVSRLKRVHAQLALVRIHAEALLGTSGKGGLPQESPAEDGFITPEDIARHLRKHLALPEGPIADLIGVLESAGCVIVEVDLGSRHIDAVSSWPVNRRPVFLVNASSPADRRRFTLAHETGHAVMHAAPTEAQEREADRFASELLAPAADIRSEFETQLTLPRLAELKRRWGMSMAALARRARDLDAISDQRYKALNIELSKSGYRTAEPVEIDVQAPRLIGERIQALLNEGRSLDDVAAIASLRPHEIQSLFATEGVTR